MVELQEIVAGERPTGPPAIGDERQLRDAVKRHLEETESGVAAALLADWPTAVGRFTKVMPADFKRVLAARAAAERDGLSDEAVTELMMEAAHG
jgi:glutamate synthase (NADPH/NADH) large chain